MSKGKAELGDRVKCAVTGFKGIVTTVSKHLWGCDRIGVTPEELDKEGKPGEAYWADIDAVEILKKGIVKGHTEVPPEVKRGGPTLRGQVETRRNPNR